MRTINIIAFLDRVGKWQRKRVRYPDGTIKLEYVCRVSYMCSRSLMSIPYYDAEGEMLDVSHLCHETLCV